MILNEKQELFAINVAAGINQTEACINAGYSKNGAAVAACRLMKNPAILARIEELKNQQNGINKKLNNTVKSDVNDVNTESRPTAENNDPLQFLLNVMLDEDSPLKLRVDAAKILMPYKHGRIGETGKKEAAKDAAAQKSRLGGLSARLEQKGLRKVK
ncbi:terminase small subunit [Snodgrassella sp. B3088]|uniref:terminase small subunit n=1 Tax=Snodgrassella sp. B3088 TaxID=2818038 RepID=UPI00226A1910|nr:terminase small subunit [Snodgrassella sp. B3088]MCX8749066.1 terminase small subunit [Snodgrassella sp. B3088]